MKKLIAILITGIVIAGCNNSGGDIFLGKWSNTKRPDIIIVITKHDGGNGYTLTRYANGNQVVETYSGLADGRTISLSSIAGVIPVEMMKTNQLSVKLIPGCEELNCVVWNKVSN